MPPLLPANAPPACKRARVFGLVHTSFNWRRRHSKYHQVRADYRSLCPTSLCKGY
jgi:hypothetical protein